MEYNNVCIYLCTYIHIYLYVRIGESAMTCPTENTLNGYCQVSGTYMLYLPFIL